MTTMTSCPMRARVLAAQRSATCPIRPVHCHASKGFGTVKAPKKPVSSTEPVVDKCPCESGKNYKNCCQKAHDGTVPAATPEAALRARFAAYVRNQPAHIIATTHPDYFPYHYNGKPATDDEVQLKFASDVEQGCNNFVYADFKVVKTEEGTHPDEGLVAMSYKCAKQPATANDPVPDDAWFMTDEKCRFLRVDGTWLFVDYQEYTRNLTGLLKKVENKGIVKPKAAAE